MVFIWTKTSSKCCIEILDLATVPMTTPSLAFQTKCLGKYAVVEDCYSFHQITGVYFKCRPLMHTTFGLPGGQLDKRSKKHLDWTVSFNCMLNYISFPMHLLHPLLQTPFLICTGLTGTIFTWNDKWSNKLDSKFGPMDPFTVTVIVIGISDFTNFRFPAKVSLIS